MEKHIWHNHVSIDSIAAILLVLVVLLGAGVVRVQGQEQWLPGQGVSGLNGLVRAVTTWDPDGAGPKPELLVVGGDFTVAGDANAPLIAAWDGQRWQPIGSEILAGSGSIYDISGVYALGVYNGQLIAGGYFGMAGSAGKVNVARWDGTNWRPMSISEDGWVYALTVYNGQLIAGGGFDTAGTVAAWNGSNWQPLGSGMDAGVTALTVYNGQLFAGGGFTTAGGIDVNSIARWDGSTWLPLGSGMSGAAVYYENTEVDSLRVYDGRLIVGGNFTTAGGVPASFIAAWDGSSWESIGGGMNEEVYELNVYNNRLIVGGQFSKAGGVSVKNIAQWDGNTWQSVGSGTNGRVYAIGAYDGNVIAGGEFGTAGDVTAKNIAAWDGSSWGSLGNWLVQDVTALTVYNDRLIAGGTFTTSSGTFAGKAARWDCSSWQMLGSWKSTDSVLSLTDYNNQLIAGGSFKMTMGEDVAAYNIAAWDGSNWQPLGTKGINRGGVLFLGIWGAVRAMTVYNGELIVGGDIITAGDEDVYNVAKWNGSSWQSLGMGLHSSVFALTVYNGQLIAAGDFYMYSAGNSVARWDGSNWQPLGGLAVQTVYALIVYNGQLIAACQGGGVGGFAYVVRWNGSSWEQLGSAIGGSEYNSELYALAIHNGQLVAAGCFPKAGSVWANNIIRWDGSVWQPMGSGVDDRVSALTVYNDQLIAGGDFITAGGNVSAYWARWGSPPYESLTRSFSPDTYTPAMPVEVSIAVEPLASTQVYSIEDAPPAGWTINASSINEGGVWDNVNNKVKWGPFNDHQSRTFTYEATPPGDESGTKTFNGALSVDCSNMPITGHISNAQQQTFTLSLYKAGNGSIRVNGTPYSLPWSGSFTTGTNVTLEAVADSGWQFFNWSGDLSGNTNPTTIQMNDDRSITVGFTSSSKPLSKFGSFDGKKNVKQMLKDCSGTDVIFSLTGGGYGEIDPCDCGFSTITLHDTSDKSTLTISTKGKIGTNVGDIIVNGSLKGITAKTTNLRGDITVTGSLGTLTLNDVADSHTITIGSSSKPKAGVIMKFDQVSDLVINSQMPIKTLSATEWLGGAINASSVGSITTKGDKKRSIAGDLDVNVMLDGSINSAKVAGTLSGEWACNSVKSISATDIGGASLTLRQKPDAKIKVLALGKLTAKGWIDFSRIISTGHIGTVTAGAIADSSCFAGVADGVSGLPDPAVNINYVEPATIKKITIKGIKSEPYCVINSNIAAARVLSAYLAYPKNDNAGVAFGVSAGFIKALKVKDVNGTESWKNLDKPSDSKEKGDAKVRLY